MTITDSLFRQSRRVIIAVIGFTVLLVGVALLVLPGPAFLVIPAELAILESLGHELNLTGPPVGAGAERPQHTLTKGPAASWRYPGVHGALHGVFASSIASM
jgi:hypothetical protein